jgi:hypothetical protein
MPSRAVRYVLGDALLGLVPSVLVLIAFLGTDSTLALMLAVELAFLSAWQVLIRYRLYQRGHVRGIIDALDACWSSSPPVRLVKMLDGSERPWPWQALRGERGGDDG